MLLDSGNLIISKQQRIVEEEISEQKQPDPISLLLLLSLEIAETNSCGMGSSTLNPRWSYREWQVHPMCSLGVVPRSHGAKATSSCGPSLVKDAVP